MILGILDKDRQADQYQMDLLRAATRHRPANCVREQTEHHPKCRRGRLIQGQKRMRCQPPEQRAIAFDPPANQPFRRAQSVNSETRHQERMRRYAEHRREKVFGEQLPVIYQRLKQTAPFAGGHCQIALQHDSASVIQRMR